MLEQIGNDLQEAVQELRNLAHGIYPPLLMDRGLGEALSAAAGRAAFPTGVEADGIGRYAQPIEAAVYFCVPRGAAERGEARGRGAAGERHRARGRGCAALRRARRRRRLRPRARARTHGHGFVNMSDRVGAIGGSIDGGVVARGTAPASPAASRSTTPSEARRAASGAVSTCALAPDVADDVAGRTPPCARSGPRRTSPRRPGGRPPGRWRGASPRCRGGRP